MAQGLNKNQATVILDARDKANAGELELAEVEKFVGPKLWAVIESLGGWEEAVKEAKKQWPLLA